MDGDLIYKLRDAADGWPADLMNDAADEIERLRDENTTFRAAQKACEHCDSGIAASVAAERERCAALVRGLRRRLAGTTAKNAAGDVAMLIDLGPNVGIEPRR